MIFSLVEIGQCCDIVNGSTPSRKKPEYWDGQIDWFTPKDLSGLDTKYVKEAPERITKKGYESCSTTLVPHGSLLYSSRAPIGHLAINLKEVCTNQGFKTLVPKKSVHVEYLYYVLKKFTPNLQALGNGATFKELSKATISGFKIPLPPLDQQKKIAAILDAADAYRQKTKALVEKYDELTQSLFLDMFGDRKKSKRVALETVVSNKKDFIDGPFGSNLKVSDQTSYGVRLIQINNIGIGQFRDKKQKFTSEEKYQSIIKHNVKPNDIVVAKMGEPLGRACIVPDFIDKGLVVADCMRIRVAVDNFSNYFVMFFLNSDDAKQQINNLSHGSTRVRINLSMLRKLEIPKPTISLQNQFAERVQAIEEQKAQARASLAQAEDLFNSLLQRAFKGELT